jgi:hypothetical protein
MKTRLRALTLVLAAAAQVGGAAAEGDPPNVGDMIYAEVPRPQRSELHFTPLASRFPAGRVQLDNGVEIDPRRFPGVMVVEYSEDKFCTATLIAHCVDLGKARDAAPPLTVTGSARVGTQTIDIRRCDMPSEYMAVHPAPANAPRNSFDFALCELEEDMPIRQETIDLAGIPAAPVLMSGYGCKNVRVEAGRIVGDSDGRKLNVGSDVAELRQTSLSPPAPGAYARFEAAQNDPILCPGDSGGAAFASASVAGGPGERPRVTGVNSLVGARYSGSGWVFLSFISDLNTQSFRDFMEGWVRSSPSTRTICGYNRSAGTGRCRG